MSLATQLKRSIRAARRAIKQEMPFQINDLLARRPSFMDDMVLRGMSGRARRMYSDDRARRCVVAQRYVTLVQDKAVWHMPSTGAP